MSDDIEYICRVCGISLMDIDFTILHKVGTDFAYFLCPEHKDWKPDEKSSD